MHLLYVFELFSVKQQQKNIFLSYFCGCVVLHCQIFAVVRNQKEKLRAFRIFQRHIGNKFSTNIPTQVIFYYTGNILLYRAGALFCFHIGNRTLNQPTETNGTVPTETSLKSGKGFAPEWTPGVFFWAVRTQIFFAPPV